MDKHSSTENKCLTLMNYRQWKPKSQYWKVRVNYANFIELITMRRGNNLAIDFKCHMYKL